MGPQHTSQFIKFRDILAKVSDDIDSDKGNSIEIFDEIKGQLEKELKTIYEEWKGSGFDVNFRFKLDDDGQIEETTLLHVAIWCKGIPCTSVVQYLLDKGADPNIKDSTCSTPLHVAACTRADKRKKIVELLLNKKADPNIVDSCKSTPLHIACMFYGDDGFNVGIVELLLKSGTDVNKKDKEENTSLHYLVEKSFGVSENSPTLEKQNLKLVKLLVKHGANIYVKNNFCETPKDLIKARRCGWSINEKLADSIEKFLEEQERSREYHTKLIELLERNKDPELLASIIVGNGLMGIRGIQVCSQTLPKILKIPGIKIVVEGDVVEGNMKQKFSQGTGKPVIYVYGNTLKYNDLFESVVSLLREDSLLLNGFRLPKSEALRNRVCGYVRDNLETVKRELWDEPSTSPKTTKAEDSATRECVSQKESDKGTTKRNLHEEERQRDDFGSKKRANKVVKSTGGEETAMGLPVNSHFCLQKEAKNPPTFPRKQKVSIAVGIAAALVTGFILWSVTQFSALAIVVSALIAGFAAYMISSKLYEVVICSGASQQPWP